MLTTHSVTDDCYVSNRTRERGYTFPLFLYPDKRKAPEALQEEAALHPWPPGKDGRRPNLNPAFVREIEQRLGLRFLPEPESVGQTFLSAQGKQGLTITRRSLPHWTLEGSTYFVTFRLTADVLQKEDRALVLEHIRSNDTKYYDLLAATVLPDHVHLLIRPLSGYSLSRIMKGIKGVSARLLNEKRGSSGKVWQQESWDRIVRDQKEFDEKLEYMLNNPVKRGLVDDPWEYDGWYLSDRADRNVCPTKTSPDQTGTFTPEDVFHYIYGILHSPAYRTRYAEFLKIDFPRIPLTSDAALFRRLGKLGAELVGLHLLKSQTLEAPDIRYDIPGSNQVEKGFPKYLAPGERDPATGEILRTGRVYLNKAESKEASGQYFDGVPPGVWEFHVGGFQVCQKWLKDRRGRELTFEDCTRYQRIVVAIRETIRLMDEIDKAIPEWPIP